MTMRICELRQKEVINIFTCRSLGCPYDLQFDSCSGKICSMIVSGPSHFWSGFWHDAELIIPWECIRQIGKDIILVELQEDLCKKK